MDLEQLVLHLTPTALAVALVVLFSAPEAFAPRIAPDPALRGRIGAIAMVALATSALTFVISDVTLTRLVELFLTLKVASMSRLNVDPWLIFCLSYLLIDFLNYAFHWLAHKVGPLWRLHAVHHSDELVTSATALLRHPLEAVAHYVFLVFFLVVLGVPLIVVTIYGLTGAAHGVFTHANIRIPPKVERVLRWFIVTPDMHRTHHSIDRREGNSNFGAMFPFWDRLFRTYVDDPAATAEGVCVGLDADERPQAFTGSCLLAYPFVGIRGR